MTVISSRFSTSGRHGRRGLRAPGGVRAALALVVLAGLLLVSACGMNAQTLKPYTPAEGVNFDVGDQSDPTSVVHVRNLLIISREAGSGIVSASLVTTGSDSLTGVSGTAYKPDGSAGGTFTATLSSRVPLASNTLEVLTNQSPLITISASDLAAGLDAEVTLQFAKAGSYTTRVPVADGTFAPYTTISPEATSSESPSASPSS